MARNRNNVYIDDLIQCMKTCAGYGTIKGGDAEEVEWLRVRAVVSTLKRGPGSARLSASRRRGHGDVFGAAVDRCHDIVGGIHRARLEVRATLISDRIVGLDDNRSGPRVVKHG